MQEAPGPSPSLDPRGVRLLEHFDRFSGLRNGLRNVAKLRDEWAGIPMPLQGMPMTIEPSWPKATEFMAIGREPEPERPPDEKTITPRNRWYSRQHRCNIWVYEEGGRVRHVKTKPNNRLNLEIMTLGASVAWGIEQEARAVQLLGTLLKHNMFKSYLLTGMFLETSQRSGLTYLFRKLRPTVVIDAKTKNDDSTRVLCCLCMHPIGYYEDTWAGAMCPTDDVLAHLMLMRGDEPMLWRRCNQHAPWEPSAGL